MFIISATKVFNIHILPPMTRRNGANNSPEFNFEKCHTCDIISFWCDANFMAKFDQNVHQRTHKFQRINSNEFAAIYCHPVAKQNETINLQISSNQRPQLQPINAIDYWKYVSLWHTHIAIATMARCTKDMRTVCPKHTHLSCSVWPRLHSPSIDRRHHSFSSTISINLFRAMHSPTIKFRCQQFREMCHRYWVGIQSSMAEEFEQTETRWNENEISSSLSSFYHQLRDSGGQTNNDGSTSTPDQGNE